MEKKFLISCNSAKKEHTAVLQACMVIDYIIEYISTNSSRISLKAHSLFTLLS